MIFLLLLFSAYAYSDEQVSVYSYMSVGGRLADDQSFKATIDLKDFDCKAKDEKEFVYWGVDGYCPTTVVERIGFWVGGKEVPFPDKIYNDMADVSLPLGFYVMQEGGEIKLYVRGGDGVASYKAVFLISSGKVKSRLVEYMDGEGDLATDLKEL